MNPRSRRHQWKRAGTLSPTCCPLQSRLSEFGPRPLRCRELSEVLSARHFDRKLRRKTPVLPKGLSRQESTVLLRVRTRIRSPGSGFLTTAWGTVCNVFTVVRLNPFSISFSSVATTTRIERSMSWVHLTSPLLQKCSLRSSILLEASTAGTSNKTLCLVSSGARA